VSATCPYREPEVFSPWPHSTSWRFILILSSHLRLGLPSGFFPSDLTTKTPSPRPIRATCHAHLFLLDEITRIIFGDEHRSWSFSLCSFLQSLITSSLLGPTFFLDTLFSDILSLRSYLKVRDHVSHSYKTKRKTVVFLSQSLYFWIPNWKTQDYAPNDSKHSLSSICS